MKVEALKALQNPLKEQYREQPESALITLKAQANWVKMSHAAYRQVKRWLKRDAIPQPVATD